MTFRLWYPGWRGATGSRVCTCTVLTFCPFRMVRTSFPSVFRLLCAIPAAAARSVLSTPCTEQHAQRTQWTYLPCLTRSFSVRDGDLGMSRLRSWGTTELKALPFCVRALTALPVDTNYKYWLLHHRAISKNVDKLLYKVILTSSYGKVFSGKSSKTENIQRYWQFQFDEQ